ncbi:MAG: cysteine desulfurase [Chthoniobacterales bacterium]
MNESEAPLIQRPSLDAVRDDFPALHQQIHGFPLVYLDNAATTQKPRQVMETLARFYSEDNSNVHRGLHELSNRATAAFDQARVTVARFLNAPHPENIVFTHGTTEAINLVANAWGGKFVKAGDTILLTEMEHHSNIVPWQLLAERVGAKVAYVPVTGDDGLLDLDVAEKMLAQGPKIFGFTHISNTLGTINPVRELCALARKQGVVTLVDAAQSAGHMPVDVQELDCDFLALSGHKTCGPTGTGILYGKAELLESMPPWHGGGEMINSVSYEKASFKAPPARFEAGTPNIAGVIGLAAALDYLENVGRAEIFAHDQGLAQDAFQRLQSIPGIRLLGPATGRAGLVTFALKEAHAHDVVMLADQRGVALRGGHHCNQPLMRKLGLASSVRASFYFYNTADEVDRLIEVIREVHQFFSR